MNYPFEQFWEDELGDRITSRTGLNWSARSPLRKDDRASFSAHIEKGVFNDFGDDELRGTHITFLEKRYGWTRAEARKYFNEKYRGSTKVKKPGVSNLSKSDNLDKNRVGTSLDPSLFHFVEVLDGSPEHRKSLAKIVKVNSIFDLDCHGTDVQERHTSAFLHTEDLLKYRTEKGGVAGYKGPCKAEFLHFDLDDKDFPERALVETRELVQRLKEAWDFKESGIRVYYSGNKGFHVYLTDGFEKVGGAFNIPAKTKSTAMSVANGLATFDSNVYDLTHIFRAPNSLNPKSGLYKVPLTLEELEKMSLNDIKGIAKTKRRLGNELQQ